MHTTTDNAFDIMSFHRLKAAALQTAPGEVRAFRLAVSLTIPPVVMFSTPRLAIALLAFCDEPDTTQLERDTLVRMTGRELASLFKLERHPVGSFLSIAGARQAIRDWLAPFVDDKRAFHDRMDADLSNSTLARGIAAAMREQPVIQEDR